MRMPAIHMRFAKGDKYLHVSLLAEFIGMTLFQLLAGSAGDDPLQCAFTFAAIMYAVKYISGGHLNPAVSLAALLSGHIDYIRGLTYMTAQVLGGIFGALLQAGMSPDSKIGHTSPGCYEPSKDISNWSLFGWELFLTFLFIAVMYASIFVRPGHGDAAPLAAGLTLFAALATAGDWTGRSPLNPARVFAAALVFKCYWGVAWIYICAHLTAAVLGALWAVWVFGKGDFFRYDSATGTLRTSLLGRGPEEPAGPVPPTFAPTGHHYPGDGSFTNTQGGYSSGGPRVEEGGGQ